MYKDPLQPGLMYHIYNRGNNKENLFKEDRNYFHFLNLSQKHLLPIADIFSYSLQPNHFHYLIQIKDAVETKLINQSFSNWFNAYTKSINVAYNRTGSLFQERFGRKIIDSDTYFNNIIFYIHANAQKHRLVEDLGLISITPWYSYQIKPLFTTRQSVELVWQPGTPVKFHAQNQKF
jgi:REP element-mobilizing transposase RayT